MYYEETTMNYIEVSNISKVYTQYNTEWQRFANWFGGKFKPRTVFQALENISFSVQAGETISIIGRNGAGKSTLLKILAGTAFPTTGLVSIKGSVSAILELSLGFSPDYSGLDNAKNALSLRGYTRSEIEAALPYIQEFSELGKYFKEEVRTYSSGMGARLAFAVVTAKRPDVLIVDEALVVGDSHFATKCFERIDQFRSSGTTLIITGHGFMASCDRALLLEQGRLLADGIPSDVQSIYAHLVPTAT